MGQRRSKLDPFPCPCCGEEVPGGRLACPHCGADADTGWSDDASKWESDIPSGYARDDGIDYDEFVADELPSHSSLGKRGKSWGWKFVVLLVVLALIIVFALGR
jgi:hypothetical protein